MFDGMTAELEVLEFLRTLVTTIKPKLIVKIGSFLGVSTLWMAEGMKRNGFGKIISCELDVVGSAIAIHLYGRLMSGAFFRKSTRTESC